MRSSSRKSVLSEKGRYPDEVSGSNDLNDRMNLDLSRYSLVKSAICILSVCKFREKRRTNFKKKIRKIFRNVLNMFYLKQKIIF